MVEIWGDNAIQRDSVRCRVEKGAFHLTPNEINEDAIIGPGLEADGGGEVQQNISDDVLESYEVYSYRHAAAIMGNSFPEQLAEVEAALREFKITTSDIAQPGGNESIIPKKFSTMLRPCGWYETRIQGDLVVRIIEKREEILENGRIKNIILPERSPVVLANYIDGHQIDYVKGRVALDLEWNSKDQTFDRDLYAFKMFHECNIISVAILVTRSAKLNEIFHALPLKGKDGSPEQRNGKNRMCIEKYGASTTWMGKLLYRLNAGRNGGCPVLVFGITPHLVSDWPLV